MGGLLEYSLREKWGTFWIFIKEGKVISLNSSKRDWVSMESDSSELSMKTKLTVCEFEDREMEWHELENLKWEME